MITNFLQAALNRVFHEDSVNTKFAGFKEGLVLVFFKIYKLVKTHIFSMGVMEDSLVQAWFSSLMVENDQRSMLSVISLHLSFI